MSNFKNDFKIDKKSGTEQSVEELRDKNDQSFNEVQKRLSTEIDVYYSTYKLPVWRVTDEQWDSFLNYFYKLVVSKNIAGRFYSIMSTLVRYTLSDALVTKRQFVWIVDFINNLDRIEDENVSKKDFLKAKKELLYLVNQENNSKIVQFPK